ncbi:3-hydroxyacyl-CoA dehydrogenase NAD-binding domain-containing protein [Streptomyces sp. NPDC059460]|uniref:3-hydroxyacyl-CoA dehydrogenase NAD-binding domain-containing protein n=1 Tax=Streptomyces sp. NPDC059460 TaxID=3346840 RepID=UPI0036C28F31
MNDTSAVPRSAPGPWQNVTVVGAGVIGASWAALFLAKGLNVTVSDPARDAEKQVRVGAMCRFGVSGWMSVTVCQARWCC